MKLRFLSSLFYRPCFSFTDIAISSYPTKSEVQLQGHTSLLSSLSLSGTQGGKQGEIMDWINRKWFESCHLIICLNSPSPIFMILETLITFAFFSISGKINDKERWYYWGA